MKKPLEKINREVAIDIRSKIDGLEENPGYIAMMEHFQKRVNMLRGEVRPITNNDFGTLNTHNRKLYLADAFEEVLLWVQNTRAQCDSIVEGGK